jgi:hypothetical protein
LGEESREQREVDQVMRNKEERNGLSERTGRFDSWLEKCVYKRFFTFAKHPRGTKCTKGHKEKPC